MFADSTSSTYRDRVSARCRRVESRTACAEGSAEGGGARGYDRDRQVLEVLPLPLGEPHDDPREQRLPSGEVVAGRADAESRFDIHGTMGESLDPPFAQHPDRCIQQDLAPTHHAPETTSAVYFTTSVVPRCTVVVPEQPNDPARRFEGQRPRQACLGGVVAADLLDQGKTLLKGLEWLGVEPLLLRVATEHQQVRSIPLPQLTQNDPVGDQNRKR